LASRTQHIAPVRKQRSPTRHCRSLRRRSAEEVEAERARARLTRRELRTTPPLVRSSDGEKALRLSSRDALETRTFHRSPAIRFGDMTRCRAVFHFNSGGFDLKAESFGRALDFERDNRSATLSLPAKPNSFGSLAPSVGRNLDHARRAWSGDRSRPT
jgi:hypothetical protein